MGLDMHAMKTREELPASTDFRYAERGWNLNEDEFEGEPFVVADEIYYWRKHPDLHGWFGRLYVEKGGKEALGEFSGPVAFDGGDLDLLEEAVENDRLPRTTGFFFGESHPDDIANDREFIRKARKAIEEGHNLFYVSSW